MAKNIKISPSRVSAYKVLNAVLMTGAYSNIALTKHLASIKIEADRRLCTNIVHGVIKKINKLEYILSTLSNTPVNELDNRVKISLYIGLYQIIYLDKIPEYALVNDSVNLVKMFVGKKTSGFVNGILRNALRKKKELKEIEFNDFFDIMYYEYGFKRALSEKLLLSYNKEELIEYAKYSMLPPNVTLRVNNLKTNREELKNRFKEKGFQVRDTFVPEGIEILSHLNVTLLEEYKKGFFSIQDCAGMVVAHTLDVSKDMKVLDMCAAPGGKSMHTAELMNNSGNIISCDIYPKKLEIMNFRMKQLGISNIMTKKHDGTVFNEEYVNKFDRVICDVPCSGFGVIRRKPEILIFYSNEKIEEIKKVQRQILENGIKYLKKGGVLIYSTCTINKEENEDIVYSVLKEYEDMKLSEIKLPFDFDYDKDKAGEGILNISGDKNNIDSFFIAKLTKI
ncbi:16S rRNA (cytosine(967)-C(5))-methyltransferase RsmB [uncultured Anaerofustis sp.]|uniref:16S rRNA (cytosine(967)-C(5))-methyltransferase RsmB n=1 Tax=uncultured Anaerofustis sp. TaxID=904996 RepID=UPI0025F00D92|nr:16S rRNA (cytosine(967)-C(5))-methyltransferase RsmB [uncultured Anaerofustis sp.]